MAKVPDSPGFIKEDTPHRLTLKSSALAPGERVRYDQRRHQLALIALLPKAVAIFLVGFATVVFVSGWGNPYVWFAKTFVISGSAYYLAYVVASWYYRRYVLTNVRFQIIFAPPIWFGKSSVEVIKLQKLESGKYGQTFFERLFKLDSGYVGADTGAQDDEVFNKMRRLRRHVDLANMLTTPAV